jgi:hypothetical protein
VLHANVQNEISFAIVSQIIVDVTAKKAIRIKCR